MNELQNHYRLAREIAMQLDDIDAISLYEDFAQRNPEHVLRRIANRISAMPKHTIRTSRGALFTHLIRKHEETMQRQSEYENYGGN